MALERTFSRSLVHPSLQKAMYVKRDHQEIQECELVNDEGANVAYHDGTRKYYCGRKLGVTVIPDSDGQCGPTGGPQCPSCRRFQAKKDAFSLVGEWTYKAMNGDDGQYTIEQHDSG